MSSRHKNMLGAPPRLPAGAFISPKNRSEGGCPNGICDPCVMGWGLARTGNSSTAAVALKNMCFLENGFLGDWIQNARSRRDSAAMSIIRTSCASKQNFCLCELRTKPKNGATSPDLT